MYNVKGEVFIYDLWFCDRLRHFHYKQFYISASDWKNKAIELKTVNYDFTTDLTTFTLEIKRNRGKR